jgi:hypothetical protein
VHRVFNVAVTAETWRYGNDTSGFSQRFTGTPRDGATRIDGAGELSLDDGATWEPDLAIGYRRIG